MWLVLLVDGDGRVTEAKFEHNTAGTPSYAHYLPLAIVTTSGSAVTAVKDVAPRTQFGGAGPLPYWAAVRRAF